MSAWIVTPGHINTLVQAMAAEGIIPLTEATEVGRMLWDENHRSVNYRYRETTPTPDYSFEGIEARLDDTVVGVQVACYEYQSCEHPGWETSRARELCSLLADAICARNGWESADDAPGWDRAPWGVESIIEAVAA